jgi:hypothetical protein
MTYGVNRVLMKAVSQPLMADGTEDGILTVISTEKIFPNAKGYLQSSTSERMHIQVLAVLNTTQIRVRNADFPYSGSANVSAYKVADGSTIYFPQQPVTFSSKEASRQISEYRYVNADGDTMTGPLVIKDQLIVEGSAFLGGDLLVEGEITAEGEVVYKDLIEVIMERAGQIEAIAVSGIAKGEPICWSSTPDRIRKADAELDESSVVGVALDDMDPEAEGIVSTRGLAKGVLVDGVAGMPYYLQVGGGVGTDMPTAGRIILVGTAVNATDLWVSVVDFGKRIGP